MLCPFLKWQVLLTVTHGLVTSRLLQSTLHGAALESILKLQLLQNAAVWAIMCTPKTAHVIALFLELYWLPVYLFIKFIFFPSHSEKWECTLWELFFYNYAAAIFKSLLYLFLISHEIYTILLYHDI